LIAVKARPIDRWIREQEERQSLESAVVRIVLHGRPEVPREATAKERRELSAWSEQRKVPKRSGGDSGNVHCRKKAAQPSSSSRTRS
jgi:hypothetical protein